MAGETNTTDQKLDAVLTHLDSLHKRMDAADERDKKYADSFQKMDTVCSRVDAWDEEKKADKARKDAADKEAEDKAKKDAEDADAKKKAEEDDKAKKDAADEKARNDAAAAARAGDDDIRKSIADLNKRLPVELPEAERQRFVAVQSRAERVAQAFGDSAGAPRWLQGETLDQYRRRLLGGYVKHSAAWKDIDLTPFADKALDTVETQVYADAYREATHPTSITSGELRMSIRSDETGRQIREFHGDPEACWAPFKQTPRLLVGLNKNAD